MLAYGYTVSRETLLLTSQSAVHTTHSHATKANGLPNAYQAHIAEHLLREMLPQFSEKNSLASENGATHCRSGVNYAKYLVSLLDLLTSTTHFFNRPAPSK